MKTPFNPLRSEAGQFRVAVCLTQLGDRAFEVLKLSETLEFDPPKFASDSSGDVWAILLDQLHPYDADPRIVVDPWDDQLSQLWQTCEPGAETKLVITHNFEAYHADIA